MQNDVRLIDANAMRDDWLENGENEYIYDTNAVLESIDSQPTIDAVPVVRCRECFYKDIPKCCPYQINGFEVVSNWYCPMGVRKMDAKDMDVPTKDGGAIDGV